MYILKVFAEDFVYLPFIVWFIEHFIPKKHEKNSFFLQLKIDFYDLWTDKDIQNISVILLALMCQQKATLFEQSFIQRSGFSSGNFLKLVYFWLDNAKFANLNMFQCTLSNGEVSQWYWIKYFTLSSGRVSPYIVKLLTLECNRGLWSIDLHSGLQLGFKKLDCCNSFTKS